MGLVNQPQDLLTRVRDLERQVREAYKKSGLSSTHISKGGLTLSGDAYLKMIDDLDVEILYIGPDTNGKQTIRIRREGGSDIFYSAFTGGGAQFWKLTDRFNRQLVSDDPDAGGLARPWLSVDLYPLFSMAASSVYAYMNLPVASVTSETVLWEGRLPLAAQPAIQVAGVWGQASGTNSATYRLKVGSTTVGTWSTGALENSAKGPYDIAAFLEQADVPVQLTVTASGTGNVAAHAAGCWTRQSA